MSISEFLSIVLQPGNIEIKIVIILILGVVFVNGWTDAPNAITASVSTGAFDLKKGIFTAAVFNFIGAVTMGLINTSVLRVMEDITLVLSVGKKNAVAVLSSALIAIIIWSVTAWYFGIPTSESHALLSGIFGAALASAEKYNNIDLEALKSAILGMLLSLPIGFVLGWILGKVIDNVSNNTKSGNVSKKLQSGQRIGAAAMAFMHGAQDSQKFAGVFLAALCMSNNNISDKVSIVPIWLTLICSTIISLGTAAGGYRIIKRVGMDTVELTPTKGLAADVSGAICMFCASIAGFPISTTHTATASVVGAGLSTYPKKVNMKSIREMIMAWLLTFPCCGAISFFTVKLFMLFA